MRWWWTCYPNMDYNFSFAMVGNIVMDFIGQSCGIASEVKTCTL